MRQNYSKMVHVSVHFGRADGSEMVRVVYLPKESLDRIPKKLLARPDNGAFSYCRIYSYSTHKLISEAYK